MPSSLTVKVAAALVLIDVMVTYGYCLRRGRYPPSHPWSGISLTVLSLSLFIASRQASTAVGWVAVALMLLAAGLWTVAAILRFRS